MPYDLMRWENEGGTVVATTEDDRSGRPERTRDPQRRAVRRDHPRVPPDASARHDPPGITAL
jgi:hypothetical protein